MEALVLLATPELLEKMVKTVTQDFRAKTARMDIPVDQDRKVCQDHPVTLDLLVKMVTLVFQDQRGNQDHLATRELPVNQGYLDHQVTYQGLSDPPVLLVRMDIQEHLDLKVIPDRLVSLDTLDYLELKV